MLIFFGETGEYDQLSPEEMQRRMGNWQSWTEKMINDGVFVDGKGLLTNSRTLTSKDGVAVDGPYLDIKESVGGYYIVKANTIEDAVKIARDYPDFDLTGGVEIRECMSDDQG